MTTELDTEDELRRILNASASLGASYAEVRYQVEESENIEVENKALKNFLSSKMSGFGIRVVVDGAVGYASSSNMNRESFEKTLNNAIKAARSIGKREQPFVSAEINEANVESDVKIDPLKVSAEEKVAVVLDANKAGWIGDQIKNVTTMYGLIKDYRLFMSTEGSHVAVANTLIGLASVNVAQINGAMEYIINFKSDCQGFEFIKSRDWNRFAVETSKVAIEGAKAKITRPGTYAVVVDPEVLGVVLHEAFGHAVEGDLVYSGASVLNGKLGTQIADKCLTVVDDGLVKGGFYHPYDDEGTKKTKTVVVENGVLKSYLLDRASALKAHTKSTGNGRAQDFENMPIVRQTNFYVEPRDYTLEELIEDVNFGLYIGGPGLKGGQVEPGNGTFTFGVGPSKIIKNGELTETVRGVNISGSILETLKTIDAVGKDLKVSTMVFGGCGKMSQRAFVGDGGPQVRIRKITVGGQ